MSVSDYVVQLRDAISHKDPQKFSALIGLNPANNQGLVRANFPIPNDFDLHILQERFRPLVVSYIKLLKSVYITNDIKKAFENYIEFVNGLNRAANNETNWINYPLMKSCKELIDVYGVMEKSYPEEIQPPPPDQVEFQTSAHTSSLETLANCINNSFKLSLTDKNLQLEQSKRVDIYFFLSCVLKLYFKLGNLDMAKSVEKALKGTRFELPKFDKFLVDKPSAISYLYYSSILSLDDSDYLSAFNNLTQALNLLGYADRKSVGDHLQKIYLIYFPLSVYLFDKYPKNSVLKQFPVLNYLYNDNIFKFINAGKIGKLEEFLDKLQMVFLKRKLYLLFESLKELCYLNLIKKTVEIHKQIAQDNQHHIIPFNAFIISFNLCHEKKFTKPEIECLLAGLISKGRIKGYLSHANGCIVLSKTVAFPKYSNV